MVCRPMVVERMLILRAPQVAWPLALLGPTQTLQGCLRRDPGQHQRKVRVAELLPQ